MESFEVTVENLGKLKRKIIVTVSKEEVKAAYDKTYLSLKDKVKIDGFRKGKFPQKLLEKRFNRVMREEAIETLVPEYFEKAVTKEKLTPAVRPKFDDLEIEKAKPLVFSAAFEIYPEFDPPEFSDYKLEKKEPEIAEEEIREQKQRHLDNAATFTPKEGVAENTDQLTIDFEGILNEESIAKADDQVYLLGSKQFLPEFEEALAGMKKEEEKTFDLTFPDDYNEEKLRGKTAQFTVKVKEIKQNQPPELNEEFFKRYGEQVKSEEDFDKFISDEVKFRKDQDIKRDNHTQLREQLADLLTFDIPEQMLEEEVTMRLQRAKQEAERAEKTEEEPDEGKIRKEAADAIRFSIFIQTTLDKKKVTVDENEANRRFEMNCAMMGINPADLINQDYGRQMYQQTYGMVAEETVLDFVTEKVLS